MGKHGCFRLDVEHRLFIERKEEILESKSRGFSKFLIEKRK